MEEINEFLENLDPNSVIFGAIFTVIMNCICSIETYLFEKTMQLIQQNKHKKEKGKSRKYLCPGCGDIIRTKKDVEIKCKSCMLDYIIKK